MLKLKKSTITNAIKLLPIVKTEVEALQHWACNALLTDPVQL